MHIRSLGKWKLAILCLALVCLLAGSGPVRAQFGSAGRGTLSGVVLTADGAPVKAAQVFYQLADGIAPHVLRTDAEGRFHSRPLRAGLYEVRAEATGKWSEWSHNVVVRGGGDHDLTLRLVRGSAPSR